jgi:hypothetical protein
VSGYEITSRITKVKLSVDRRMASYDTHVGQNRAISGHSALA